MNTRYDGGPAFPHHPGHEKSGQGAVTLRDYFAAHAPPYPFNPKIDLFDDSGRDLAARLSERDAEWRFVYADAMLTERAK